MSRVEAQCKKCQRNSPNFHGGERVHRPNLRRLSPHQHRSHRLGRSHTPQERARVSDRVVRRPGDAGG
ncbi:MAG: hypothetical protein DMG09_27755, partial [Acidobacteria bacterium]